MTDNQTVELEVPDEDLTVCENDDGSYTVEIGGETGDFLHGVLEAGIPVVMAEEMAEMVEEMADMDWVER